MAIIGGATTDSSPTIGAQATAALRGGEDFGALARRTPLAPRFGSSNGRAPARSTTPRQHARSMTSADLPSATAPDRTSLAGRYWWLLPLAIAMCSRVFSLLLLLRYAGNPDPPPTIIDDASPMLAWDAGWYLHIAETGYHPQPLRPSEVGGNHDFAFYPAWPIVIRLASLGGALPMAGTAVVLANVLFILAAVAIYRYLMERFAPATALPAVVLLAFSPPAYVFSMAYSETLFLLIAALFFLDRFGRLSPFLGLLAALARVSGLAIGAAAAAVLVLRREARLGPFLVCASVALGFGLWWVYIWQLTG